MFRPARLLCLFSYASKRRRTVAPLPLPEAIPVADAEVEDVLAEIRRELSQPTLLVDTPYENQPLEMVRPTVVIATTSGFHTIPRRTPVPMLAEAIVLDT